MSTTYLKTLKTMKCMEIKNMKILIKNDYPLFIIFDDIVTLGFSPIEVIHQDIDSNIDSE